MKTSNFRGPSCRAAMVLLCRLRTNKIDVYHFPICFILVSKVVTSGFFWRVDFRTFVFVFPSVYVSYLKVDLGSRGCSWLASPDEYRLCILLVLVRRMRTSFRIFSGTSSLGTFRFLLTFDIRLFLVSNCFRTRRSACRDSGYMTASVNAALRGPTADTVHASTETPSLLTPIASVRNVFTVGVERSIGPALFLEVEFQSKELCERDVGEISGLNVLYDVIHVFYSSWSLPAHPTLSP